MEPTLDCERRRSDIPAIVWLWLPLATVAVRIPLALLSAERWESLLGGETGLIENLTVAFLLPAIVLGVVIFLHRKDLPRRVGWLMLLVALAALYFAGEECSWGQVYLGFPTPETLGRINDQNEFNIHRTSNLFSNVPRQLMLAATLVGGVILPLAPHVLARRRRLPGWIRRLIERGRDPAHPLHWIVPNYRLVVVSLMALCLRLPEKLTKLAGVRPHEDTYIGKAFFRDSGEFTEFYYALVILLYLLSVYLRMRRRPLPPAAAR